MGRSIKIGRLNLSWGNKKSLVLPGKQILNILGFSVLWSNADTSTIVREGYLNNSDIYTVVNKVARTASFAPFRVYRIKDQWKHKQYKAWTGEGATGQSIARAMMIKSQAYEEDNSHPLNKLIERPNQWQKSREFTENCIGFKLITGERFLHVIKLDAGANEGNPYAIYNLPPQYMVVVGDGTLMGIGEYIFMLGKQSSLKIGEVIFSRYWNPGFDSMGGHLRGLSPWKAGCRLMTLSNAVMTRSVIMLQNAGSAGIVFEKPTAGVDGMTQEQAALLKDKVNTEVIGIEHANAITVANGDLGYLNLGIKGSEMELQKLAQLAMERICAIISVPPVLFNTDRAIQNNMQEAKKELVVSACCPELDSLRDDWNEVAKLYKKDPNADDDIYVDYDLSVYPELQEDLKKLMEIYRDAWWTTGNEKRLGMYMDENKDVPEMDDFLVPSNLVPIGDMGANLVDQTLNNGSPGNQTESV